MKIWILTVYICNAKEFSKDTISNYRVLGAYSNLITATYAIFNHIKTEFNESLRLKSINYFKPLKNAIFICENKNFYKQEKEIIYDIQLKNLDRF